VSADSADSDLLTDTAEHNMCSAGCHAADKTPKVTCSIVAMQEFRRPTCKQDIRAIAIIRITLFGWPVQRTLIHTNIPARHFKHCSSAPVSHHCQTLVQARASQSALHVLTLTRTDKIF
jgi:hypothetical protein